MRRPTRAAEAHGHDATRPNMASWRNIVWRGQQRASAAMPSGLTRQARQAVTALPASLTMEAANDGMR